MVEPPPRDPPEPEDETVIVPPDEQTVVRDEWEQPEGEVVVERTEEPVPPRRRPPLLWPGLLAVLVLVLGGLVAAYFLTRDDDEPAAPTTTASTTTTAAQLVSVPDVVGVTVGEASATVQGAGFEVTIDLVPSDAPAGQVVAQAPAAGTDAPEGSAVRINVAEQPAETTTDTTTDTATTTTETTTTAPPEPAIVPDIVGQELADGARAFADEGLKVSVRYVPSTEAAGRVIAQAQPAGTERKRGDTVQVNVSVGAEPAAEATVPRVVGQRNDEARSALEDSGFEALALSLEGDVRNESIVSSQTPASSASVPGGSLVILYLAA